jgi:hypothetical protein
MPNYSSQTAFVTWLALVGDVAPPTLLERLDERTRGKVLLALAGLMLLGALMIGLTWLTFRIIRRQIREHQRIVEKQRHRTVDADDWAKKPLVPPASGTVDEA